MFIPIVVIKILGGPKTWCAAFGLKYTAAATKPHNSGVAHNNFSPLVHCRFMLYIKTHTTIIPQPCTGA
jgi:hypothetical protein